MMKWLIALLIPLLCHCGGGFGGTSVGKSPAVINVSGWDPKEVQRQGDRFSEHDVSAVRRNGALGFIQRVEQRTGVTPVAYLENSAALRTSLSQASPEQKRIIRRAPYWIALYGPGGTERNMGGELTPDGLMQQYGVWNEWAMWQYGGVIWQHGRSNAKHYNTRSWRSPKYFGTMAQPMERNVFRGSEGDLTDFWNRHGFAWW